ncbi:hypothetical protein E1218_15965 [Kribbella turkmenica]|uniref:Uncharacterized protein n=1 Tax=Kribbella turkmenica TaxID=2530375 RepID=A0A4R4X3I4_9ACTN|nr:hypothetical protein [Kribbella turkmenica]TDD24836.1 hypothetical protein E1218_15965 [Kribbella turkmenica]
MHTRRFGKSLLQAALTGVVAALAYEVLVRSGAPLCAPSATHCVVDLLGVLFTVQVFGLAVALALPVYARRAGLGWVPTVAAGLAVVGLNLAWFAVATG